MTPRATVSTQYTESSKHHKKYACSTDDPDEEGNDPDEEGEFGDIYHAHAALQ